MLLREVNMVGGRDMNLQVQHEIERKLGSIKAAGLLSDYLVSWNGHNGALDPAVTVWRAGEISEREIKTLVANSLLGLVPDQKILVLAD
jgi:hypothetical protein